MIFRKKVKDMNLLKKLFKGLVILVSGILVGTILLLVVFALPTQRMRANLMASLPVLEQEDTYFRIDPDHYYAQLDNFTDGIMLANAISGDGKNFVDAAMNVYRITYGDMKPDKSLAAHLKGDGELSPSIYPYARYWHGYLIFLKPLLMFFNYSYIRVLNVACQLFLLTALAVMLTRRGLTRIVPALILAYVFLYPAAMSLSLQFSPVFYVAFGSGAVMLLINERLKKRGGYCYFFLLTGMCASYFDLLTYPIAALGIPMALYFVLNGGELRGLKWLKDIIILSLCWGAGYVGMWAGKWTVATALTGNNIFKDALGAFATRGGAEAFGEEMSRFSGLLTNFELMGEYKPLIALIALYTLLTLGAAAIVRIRGRRLDWAAALPMLVIMVMPCVWLTATTNHAYIHFWFTFRNFAASLFAYGCALAQLSAKPAPEEAHAPARRPHAA